MKLQIRLSISISILFMEVRLIALGYFLMVEKDGFFSGAGF
jgi:hypothetical protein